MRDTVQESSFAGEADATEIAGRAEQFSKLSPDAEQNVYPSPGEPKVLRRAASAKRGEHVCRCDQRISTTSALAAQFAPDGSDVSPTDELQPTTGPARKCTSDARAMPPQHIAADQIPAEPS